MTTTQEKKTEAILGGVGCEDSGGEACKAPGFHNISVGENEKVDKDGPPGPGKRFACRHRYGCFGFLFVVNVGFIVLTVALAVAHFDPINLDNLGEVGIVMPEDDYQRRANAYFAAKDEADFALGGGKCQRPGPHKGASRVLRLECLAIECVRKKAFTFRDLEER